MTETELLPCPFCGGEAETHQTIERWIATCSSDQNELDGFTHMAQAYGTTEAEAIEAWNTRATLGCGTCRNKATSLRTFWCDCCDCALEDWMDVGGNLVNGLRYCPNCGRKVVKK